MSPPIQLRTLYSLNHGAPMAFFSSRNQRSTALINGRSIPVEPSETLLQAALRQGIDFPNSCRVGGCGTCKCKLHEGQVKELTESGYLLTREEIDAGYILACQSVPLTDVHISVDLAESASTRRRDRTHHRAASGSRTTSRACTCSWTSRCRTGPVSSRTSASRASPGFRAATRSRPRRRRWASGVLRAQGAGRRVLVAGQ